MKKIVLILFFILLPSTVSAVEFAQQAIFLSKSPVTDGQKVRVYAIVSNDGSTAFSGTVLIQADGATLGSPAATLAVGATETVSVPWTPAAGQHVVTAQLVSGDGTVVEQISQPFSIAAPPAPATATSTDQPTSGYESSAQIQQYVQTISPAVATDTEPVFSAIDSFRSSAANALDGQITKTKQTLSAIPKTTSAGSSAASYFSGSSISSMLWTVYLYVLTALRFLVDNAALFYPLLVLVFLYLLWRLYKRMSGSNRRR